MGLSRILKKVNKAKQAISSLKGIASKLQNLNYNSVINSDELKSQADAATKVLDKRRKSLQKSISAKNTGKKAAKTIPEDATIELQYPLKADIDNWIVFSTRHRHNRQNVGVNKNNPDGGTRDNLLSKGNVEIALYIPDGAQTSDTVVKYSGDEGVGQAMRGMVAGNEGFNAMGMIEGMLAGVTQTADKMMNSLSGGSKFFLQGKAVNPQLEQMLDGVDFRDFSWDFDFWPKSAAEADMVNTIIYWFKTAMLPDTYPPQGGGGQEAGESAAAGEAFFNYPNIFDIRYEGPVSKKLDRFHPMVLTNCSVDHNLPSKFATYSDGQPIATSMNLQFTEIRILTQESYQELSVIGESALKGSDSLLDTRTMAGATDATKRVAAGGESGFSSSGKSTPPGG
jgi:hypothetical protein